MEYEIQSYTRDDASGIAELQRHLLSSDTERNRRYFAWKYETNPFLPEPLAMVVVFGGQIIGMRGLFGTAWQDTSCGEQFVLPHADDLVIHPDHRGRGLFVPLMEALLARASDLSHQVVVSLSGGETTQALSLATGWKEVGAIERHARASPLARPRRKSASLFRTVRRKLVRRLPTALKTRFAETEVLPAESAINAITRAVTRSGRIVAEPEEFLDGVEALLEKWDVSHGYSMVADRSAAYLRWRLRNPYRKYRIFSLSDTDARGFLILSWVAADPRFVRIAEFQAADDAAFQELIEAVSAVDRLDLEMLTPQRSSRRTILEERGFVPIAKSSLKSIPRRFLVKVLSDPGRLDPSLSDALACRRQWRFNLLETMQV